MKITLVSDAWHPQINGVVTTLANTAAALRGLGHEAQLLTPDLFRTYPWPGYPDVGIAFLCGPKLRPMIKAFRPDAIHLVTEGSIGYAARRFCRAYGYCYTSSYLSRFPDYFKMRIGFPKWISSAYLRWFHSESARVMVAAGSLAEELGAQGYRHLCRWPRGVDGTLFRPYPKAELSAPRPIFMYAGRVAVEKNIEAFLRLDLPGSKYVVGDGPYRQVLQQQYPAAHFTGYRQGEALAHLLAAADVLVFPSRTDTFGVVMLEALACGTPVAAYPVAGPKDVILDDRIGVLHENLGQAALAALSLDRDRCRRYALDYTWRRCTQSFVDNLAPLRSC